MAGISKQIYFMLAHLLMTQSLMIALNLWHTRTSRWCRTEMRYMMAWEDGGHRWEWNCSHNLSACNICNMHHDHDMCSRFQTMCCCVVDDYGWVDCYVSFDLLNIMLSAIVAGSEILYGNIVADNLHIVSSSKNTCFHGARMYYKFVALLADTHETYLYKVWYCLSVCWADGSTTCHEQNCFTLCP